MKKSLSKMNTNELRDLAAELGADRKKLYGTSKQSLILTIRKNGDTQECSWQQNTAKSLHQRLLRR